MYSSSSFWTDRSAIQPERTDPYLHLHFVFVYVRDQERSLRFYLDQLGFSTVVDFTFESGQRWIEVAPPDGTAKLALIFAKPGSDEEKLIGRFTTIYFVTENVLAKYQNWCGRGVRFESAPERAAWGGMATHFQDVDGNWFGLVEFDEATNALEMQRRKLAARAEAERRFRQEIEIAKQVQTRLLPQRIPARPSLSCAGICIQARQVGGDYYDFIELGPNQLCFAIADISGKGLGAALLMANLQAALRSQSAIALESPERFLQTINQLFYENTADNSYATLFFATYREDTHKLTYVNCGHLPGLLMQSDGNCRYLDSTGTVLGLFDQWVCSAESCELVPNDVLVLYTDGVTESVDASGEEFGLDRLERSVRNNRHLSAESILSALVDEVRRFSTAEQYDDITAIVLKCEDVSRSLRAAAP